MDDTDLTFIKTCVLNGRMFWTYHSGMRLEGRGIARETIIRYIDSAEIIISYDDDTPLPSCLCLLHGDGNLPIHVVIAVDKPGNNIRFVTVYKPDATQWSEDFRKRRRK